MLRNFIIGSGSVCLEENGVAWSQSNVVGGSSDCCTTSAASVRRSTGGSGSLSGVAMFVGIFSRHLFVCLQKSHNSRASISFSYSSPSTLLNSTFLNREFNVKKHLGVEVFRYF